MNKTLVAKIAGVAFLSCGAGWYITSKKIFNVEHVSSHNDSSNYIIVKTKMLENSFLKNENLYKTSIFSSPKKNFKCVLNNDEKIFDSTCEIFKLQYKEKKLASKISNNHSPSLENLQKNNYYFKLTADKKFINSIKKWNDSKEAINILQNDADNNSKNKRFAKLIPVYKVENEKIVDRQSSFLFAKTTEENNNSPSVPLNNDNYQCQINIKDKFDCDISDFAFNNEKKSGFINKSKYSEKNLTVENLSKKDQYFKIKLNKYDLDKFNFDSSEIKKIEIVPKNPKVEDSTKKYATLTPKIKVLDDDFFYKKTNNRQWITVLFENSEHPKINEELSEKYKLCDFRERTKNISCEIYSWDPKIVIDEKKTIEDLDFSKALKKATKNNMEDVGFFVVKFTDLSNVNSDDLQSGNIFTLKTLIKNKKNYYFYLFLEIIGKTDTADDDVFIIDVR